LVASRNYIALRFSVKNVGEARQLQRSVQAFVRQFGLLSENSTPCGRPLSPSHAHALMIIRQGTATGVSQTDLRAHLRVDKSNVARLCQKMESAGHIVQVKDAVDERVRRLELTAKGRKVATDLETGSQRKFAGILKRMTAKERQAVLHGLEILNKAISTKNSS
jgi:DNA-binding MarR family transcriptional regulator